MGFCRLFLILSFLVSSAFADSEKEKIYSLLGTLPKVTTAKIQRGKTIIPIDFSQGSAKTQIQDYDVIFLDEGVYTTLGDFTAKYVRVRGQGPRKTFITSIPKTTPLILVNSTEFWDLTIANAQFKIAELNGLWAVNVEFAGSIMVKPSGPGKSPAFAVRSVFSDLSHTNLPMDDESLYSHFLTKNGDEYLMPMPGEELKSKRTAANLLAYEDKFDQAKDINLKNRIGYKGLFARGLNYLYQKEVLTPQYDHAKYNQLAKNARSTKASGHFYVAMLYWAEADRLSGHSRFDEVLREISPLTQSLGQECGCTVEGQGLASNTKAEIEKNLYAQMPITGLPGKCKIQTLHVNLPAGGNKAALIAAARQKNESDQMVAYQDMGNGEEEMLVGASFAPAESNYTTVADVEMPGLKRSYISDKDKSVDKDIISPLIKAFKEKFAKNLKAAKIKIASSDIATKIDGFLTEALYGEKNPARQTAYEDLHEQQFGRKISSVGAASSVFAY